ncbi:hypothetical protein [Streptomyces atratus]
MTPQVEVHGYLRRTRERLPNGRVVTRTCSYNQPGSTGAHPVPAPRQRPKPIHPAPVAAPAPALAPVATPAPPTPEVPEAPAPPVPTAVTPTPPPRPASPYVPAPTAPKPPPLPQPAKPLPQLLDAATALLTDLHRRAPHITLTERDIHHLAPAVATWFERGTTPAAVRQALTSDLPQPLRFPAKFLRHRLIALLPPPTTPAYQPAPLQNCDRCDRAFRSPTPGNCHDCAADEPHLLSA